MRPLRAWPLLVLLAVVLATRIDARASAPTPPADGESDQDHGPDPDDGAGDDGAEGAVERAAHSPAEMDVDALHALANALHALMVGAPGSDEAAAADHDDDGYDEYDHDRGSSTAAAPSDDESGNNEATAALRAWLSAAAAADGTTPAWQRPAEAAWDDDRAPALVLESFELTPMTVNYAALPHTIIASRTRAAPAAPAGPK